ncbi:ACT domain-containing protein [bacterium]|nr:ACT domain-containing protein [bacterium]
MTSNIRISIFCPDRVGLISAITGKLFDLGINLGDTNFAVLGTGAEYAAVCETHSELDIEEIEEHLKSLPELENADISVNRFDLSSVHGPTASITHRITIKGGDNPGLVARLSEVFVEFKANIVRLNSEKIPGEAGNQYLIDFSVWIPEESTESCLATISNTANTLQMHCQVKKV